MGISHHGDTAAPLPCDGGRKGDIDIRTPRGVVHCSPGEIVVRRFGISVQRESIVLEYAVPKLGLLAHHPIKVVWESSNPTAVTCTKCNGDPDPLDITLAEKLQKAHGRWLAGVLPAQLARLIARLRAARGKTGKEASPAKSEAQAELAALAANNEAEGYKARPRKPRAKAIPKVLARARVRPKPKAEDVRTIFDEIDSSSAGFLSADDFFSYFADGLGFGQADCWCYFDRHCSESASLGRCLKFDDFLEGFPDLNPANILKRKEEVIVRKPGSLAGVALSIAELERCEVYICTPTEQVFLDECKGCHIMLGPCSSSIFTRDCEDCTFWIAGQQLRTRNCTDCTYYLYSKTEPIIEESVGLAFAPWCASYPHCAAHFADVGFDPKRNFWNALFDFTGKKDTANWRILALDEVQPLSVELDEAPDRAAVPSNPVPKVTHEVLCADPLSSGEGTGQTIANIPQTRPALPARSTGPVRATLCVLDEHRAARVG